MNFKIGNIFKGLRGILRGVDDIILRPIKQLAISAITGASINEIKDEAKARVLAFLANEYEDKALAEISSFVRKLFDVLEKKIILLPDFLEDPILAKAHLFEEALLKFIDRLDARIDVMKSDNKITDNELDEVVKMITEDLFEELMKIISEITAYFTPTKEEEEEVKAEEKYEVRQTIFSEDSKKYLEILEEKHRKSQ